MKVEVNQEALTRVLKRATLSSGTALNPIHSLVKIEAKRGALGSPDALVFSGTSGTMSINTSVRATVTQAGVTAASIRDLTNAANAMPAGDISMAVTASRLKLKGSSGRTWSGATSDPGQIQPVPEPKDLPWLRVPTGAARLALERVSYATANMTDEQRNYDGVLFSATPGRLSAVCVSRYQCVLFEQQAHVELKRDLWESLLPTMALSHIREIVDEAEADDVPYFDLYEDQRFLYTLGPTTLLVAALPIGQFPPYRQLLSNFPKERACVLPRLALMESIKACLMTRGSKLEPGGILELAAGQVSLSRKDNDSDFFDTTTLVECEPHLNLKFKIGLTMMLDLLKAADSDPGLVIGGDGMHILTRTSGGYTALLTLMGMTPEPPEAPKP